MTKIKHTWMFSTSEFFIILSCLVINLPKLHIFSVTAIIQTNPGLIFIRKSIVKHLCLRADIRLIGYSLSIHTAFNGCFRIRLNFIFSPVSIKLRFFHKIKFCLLIWPGCEFVIIGEATCQSSYIIVATCPLSFITFLICPSEVSSVVDTGFSDLSIF